MIERQKSFLKSILGDGGSNALFKSLERSELIAQALLPRAIFSWVKGVGEFEGVIPGGEELICFAKSETGFNGNVGEHEFKDASLIHVSAVLAVTMGTEKGFNAGTKSADLERLGKSIDLLVRSKLAQEGLEKAEKKPRRCGKHPNMDSRNCLLNAGHKEDCSYKLPEVKPEDIKKDELEKASPEAPVKNAAPVAPVAPIAAGQTPAVKPAGPPAVATAPKMPKIKTGAPKPAGATVALTRSEMNHVCPMCAGKQFEGDEFIGCICFQVLNKSIDMLALDELGCVIHVSEDLDTIKTLMEAMGRY